MSKHCVKIVIFFAAISYNFLPIVAIWGCNSDADCSTLEGAVCTNTVCLCPTGTQIVDNGRSCSEVAPYHYSSCVEDFQCSKLFTGYHCRKENGERDGRCRCLEGHHYFIGRCWETKDMGDTCTRDEECRSAILTNPYAMTCQENTCACADGYYLRQRGECRKIGLAVGDACVLDIDCQFNNGACDIPSFTCYDTAVGPSRNTNATSIIRKITSKSEVSNLHATSCGAGCSDPYICDMILNLCVCPVGYYNDGDENECFAEIGSPATLETCPGLFSTIEDGRCSCLPNFYTEVSSRDCAKATVRFTDTCLSDEMCYTFGAASVCGEPGDWGMRFCECIPELAVTEENNMMCRLFNAIGEECQVDSDCMAGNVEIQCKDQDDGSRRCACPDDLAHVGDLCITAGLELGDACQVTAECTGTPNAVCTNNVCSCDVGFSPSGNICAPGLGGSCNLDSDCLVADSTCQQGGSGFECHCAENFIEYEDTCWIVSTGYNSSCTIDRQCEPNVGEGAACVNETCVCGDAYHYNNEACWPITGIFEQCTHLSQCYLGEYTDRVVCRNGYCECDFDFQYNQDTNTCDSATKIFASSLLILITMFALIK